jgi:hypothetical protein
MLNVLQHMLNEIVRHKYRGAHASMCTLRLLYMTPVTYFLAEHLNVVVLPIAGTNCPLGNYRPPWQDGNYWGHVWAETSKVTYQWRDRCMDPGCDKCGMLMECVWSSPLSLHQDAEDFNHNVRMRDFSLLFFFCQATRNPTLQVGCPYAC